jgi:phage repressor protein C with HTH and peptisase S24 domain
MDNEIADRIRDRRMLLGFSQRDMASLIGVTSGAISRWERSTAKPNAALLPLVAETLGVGINWLLFGTEGRRRGESGNSASCINVPFYDSVDASAGFGYVNDNEVKDDSYPIPASFIDRQSKLDEIVCIRCKGDSMEPVFRNGSVIAINCSERSVIDGAIYVLRVGDTLRLKILSQSHKGLVLTSYNVNYKEELILWEDCRDVKIVGKVFYHSTYFDL